MMSCIVSHLFQEESPDFVIALRLGPDDKQISYRRISNPGGMMERGTRDTLLELDASRGSRLGIYIHVCI